MRFLRPCKWQLGAAIAVATMLDPAFGIAQTCMVNAVTMNFGSYDPHNPVATLTTGTISFHCLSSVPVKIKLLNGNGGGPRGTHLNFRNSALQFELFLDPARTTLWGDGLNGTAYYSGQAPQANTTTTVPVFGEIPSGQPLLPAGAYNDMLTIEIDY